MPNVDIKLTHGTKTAGEVTLLLNAYNVPRLKERIMVDNVLYTVRSVIYNTKIDQTTGDYYIDLVKITADDERKENA